MTTEVVREHAGTSARDTFLRRVPEWLVVICLGVFGVIVYSIPYWLNNYFFYVGDNPESFIPLWHHLGEQLRAGHLPTMEAGGWIGGNYVGEAAYSLWNPLDLVNYIFVSLINNLNAGAAVVVIEFLAILAMGVYLLAREYGASRLPAVLVGLGLPICGFTLYYEASGWPDGLMSLTWVTWFWWAARRHARGRLTPLVPFIIGVLAITVGNPYAPLTMMVVLIGISVELIRRRSWRRLRNLILMGACAGSASLLMFLPLLGALKVTNRQTLAMIANDGFMVPHLSDLVTSSAPSYLPPIVNWGGAVIESVPSTYLIWFLVPLLPWLRWSTLRRKAGERPLLSVFVITGVFLAMVVGPSNLWLFRWPMRLIEYFWVGIVVMFAVVLSSGLAKDRIKVRSLITLGAILVAAYLSVAQTPQYHTIHAEATILVLVLVFGALWLYHKRGWRAFGAILVVGTIAVLSFQTARLPVVNPGSRPYQPPVSVSSVQAGTSFYQGTVLQLGSEAGIVTSDATHGEILFGNQSWMTNHEMINHYSGIGFQAFTDALCMDYKGQVCPQAFDKLWQTVPGTNIDLIDALRVRTLVIQRIEFPQQASQQPRPGWHVAARDHTRTVWIRNAPLPYPGRVNWASAGTTITSATEGASAQTIAYSSPRGGQVLLAALDWPGYTANVDGHPVTLRQGPDGLILVSLPAGQHVVDISYAQPGLRFGAYVLAVAAAVAIIQSLWLWFSDRRRRRRRPEEPVTSGEPEELDDTMRTVLSHTGPGRDGQ